ncbi:MAG: hypothetical protein RSB70_03645 [Clostridium sp.]
MNKVEKLIFGGLCAICITVVSFLNFATGKALDKSNFMYVNYVVQANESLEDIAYRVAYENKLDAATVINEMKRVNPGAITPGSIVKVVD